MTKAKMGRPAIGDKIEARLSAELAERLQAYTEARGMSRAEAVRHLLTQALQISDATTVLDTVERHTVDALFPEAEGDLDEAYELLAEEAGCSEHRAEIIDTVADVEVTVMAARGHWVLVVDRGPDGRTFRVRSTAEAARDAFAAAVVALTDELWTEGELWCDFAADLDLFYDLARTGRIPAAAIGGLPETA